MRGVGVYLGVGACPVHYNNSIYMYCTVICFHLHCYHDLVGDCSLIQFGVVIKLSKFTLSKLVVITPYYLVINQTDVSILHYTQKFMGLLFFFTNFYWSPYIPGCKVHN